MTKFAPIALFVALLSLSATVFAQSEAQRSFDTLKKLAGSWEGPVAMDMEEHNGDKVQVSMRVTSRGNALVHEMNGAGQPADPAKYDHPLTMFYLDADQLFLTHYCDAGNRPRMVGKASDDGKKVEFDFVDLAGSNKAGHMYHAVFTIIDDNHHIEDWTYMLPGDKPMHAHMDLHRAKIQQASAR